MRVSQFINGRRIAGVAGAVAAGLGAGQSSDAAVIFSEVDVPISDGVNDPFPIDFDGNGVNEFSLFADENNVAVSKAWDAADPTNPDNFAEGAGVINALDPSGANRPANLALGTLIGSGDTYGVEGRALTGRDAPDEGEPAGSGDPAGNFQVSHGPGYIGVEFLIENNTHYGYVGYEGTGAENDPTGRVFKLGYEDTPDLGIQAGSEVSIPEPTSLALLAAGAAGVGVYRRRRRA